MKTILASLALLLVSVAAHAETITLSSEPCTATKICFNVPNDAGLTIDYISDATQYERLVVSIDGDIYDSGLWAVQSLADVPLYDGEGNVIYATLDISVVQKPCVRSGRVTVCPKVVTLFSGTIQR